MARVAVGKGLYGRCDQIDNVGHVAHYFLHMGYSPIIPLGSVFVLADDEGFIKIPFSFKALLFGYLRATLVWGLGAAGFLAFFAWNGTTINLDGPHVLTRGDSFMIMGVVVALLVVLVLSYVIARPSQARKDWLMNHLRQAGAEARGEHIGVV